MRILLISFFSIVYLMVYSQYTYPPEHYGQTSSEHNLPIYTIEPPIDSLIQPSYESDRKLMSYGTDIHTRLDRDDMTLVSIDDHTSIYKLKLKCKNALGLGVYFDHVVLPPSAKIWVYNSSHTSFYGPIESSDVLQDGIVLSGLISTDELIIMLLVDTDEQSHCQFKISKITYCYRPIKTSNNFGDASSCMLNAVCSESNGIQDLMYASVRINVKYGTKSGWCSGTIVNNTSQDFKPYILTANHCRNNAALSDIDSWQFFFNYRHSTCSGSGFEPKLNVLIGATARAYTGSDGGENSSDFLLLELKSPIPNTFGKVVFAGWNRSASLTSNSGFCFHHPEGDVQKISLSFNHRIVSVSNSVANTHIEVNWAKSANGHSVTEPGSSGSGLFDSQKLLIGTLTGGSSKCSNPFLSDAFGRFFFHWDQNSSNAQWQLKPWLDPTNTGAITLRNMDLNGNTASIGNAQVQSLQHLLIKNKVKIWGATDPLQINIYNLSGQLIHTESFSTPSAFIDLNSLPRSIYIVHAFNLSQTQTFRIYTTD